MKISETLMTQEKSGYYLECNFMIGDADGYEQKNYPIEPKNLEKTILFCLMMDKQYPRGRGGCDDYYMEKIHPLAEEIFETVLNEDWAYEPYDGGQCSWRKYEIILYKNGLKYKINYELDNDDKKILSEAKVLDW